MMPANLQFGTRHARSRAGVSTPGGPLPIISWCNSLSISHGILKRCRLVRRDQAVARARTGEEGAREESPNSTERDAG